MKSCLAAALCLLANIVHAASAQADEIDALLATLARPAPDRVGFVELRYSPLLEAPIVAAGTLEYLGPGKLARHVAEPYRETTLLDGEQVRISREGSKDRQFSLKRAPELRGILSSFSAILSGDGAALRQYFELALERRGERWILRLAPREAGLKRKLGPITVSGERDHVSCIRLGADPASGSVTLVGAASKGLPEVLTRVAADKACADHP